MHQLAMIDWALSLGGLLGGFLVGLTGMGGGALLTPMLVLVFGVSPAAAVGSDLVASLIAKPFGGAIHWRHGTVRKDIVLWLCLGSVPGAFSGALLLKQLGDGANPFIEKMLGVMLMVAVASMVYREVRQRRVPLQEGYSPLRSEATLLVGLLGGAAVGITSVGSGSLMLAALTVLYPTLTRSELVGTDLTQAVPLVGAAVVAHLFFGEVEFGVTSSLVVGLIPGIIVGARISSRYDGRWIRLLIPVLLFATGIKLLLG